MITNYKGIKSFEGDLETDFELLLSPKIGGVPYKVKLSQLLSFLRTNGQPELLFTSVDGVTIDETTGSAIGEGIGSKVVNVSEISKHTIYKIELQGFLDIEDTPENIVIKLKLGATELVSDTFTAINFPGLTDEPIKATYYIGINSTGSSGGVIASSEFHTSVYSLNITGTVTGGSSTPVAVDLSTNKTIDITVNAGIGCTWKTAIVEIQKLN